MEIERKWLIDPNNIPYDLSQLDSYSIVQDFVSFYPTIRIRSINNGEKYILTVKTKTPDPLAKNEYEVPISYEEYANLLKIKSGREIKKRRFLVRENDLLLEIDIFEGEFKGLAYLEIEFDSLEKAYSYQNPDWSIKDVSTDVRYKNSSLARNGMEGLL